MKRIPYNQLEINKPCLFQLSSWATQNLKFVRILFVGEKYIVMYNIDQQEEYCVNICPHEAMLNKREAVFYTSPERTE